MRKIAREAIIFCLLGAAIGSAYFLVQQYRTFREVAASEAKQLAASKQTNPHTPDILDGARRIGPGWDSPPGGSDSREPSKALILFQRSLLGAILGFPGGLALWCAYRLVRFAILG